MSVIINHTKWLSAIRPSLGRYCFDLYSRRLARTSWEGLVGFSSDIGEVRTSPNLLTIQVVAGLVDPKSPEEPIPVDQRQPGLFFVEPRDLPAQLKTTKVLDSLSAWVAFCPELFDLKAAGGDLNWLGGSTLSEMGKAADFTTELLPSDERSIGETMLLNLTLANGQLRSCGDLRQEILKLQAKILRSLSGI